MSIYSEILASIFLSKYKPGDMEVPFSRVDIIQHARERGLNLPKNIGDVIYSFRYRAPLPLEITKTTLEGYSWAIFGDGDAQYVFRQCKTSNIIPNLNIEPILIPDNTPEIINLYSLSDEQSLLSKVRYNRILDMFLGIVTYSLQNHLRTKVDKIGQIEIDELYVGVNKLGQHFIVPVQAKGNNDRIGVVQLHQDVNFCQARFPHLVCVPIGVYYNESENRICMFRLKLKDDSATIIDEKHYKLVNRPDISNDYIAAINREITPVTL